MSKTLLACILVVAGCGGMAQNSGESSASSAVSCPASVPAWSTNTAYSAGSFVSYNGKIYQCVQSHTAQGDRANVSQIVNASSPLSGCDTNKSSRFTPSFFA